MPLKLSVALSRKVGEANFGSRGATVGLELEVDSSLVGQPRRLHKRVARLFQLARESVQRELHGTPGSPAAQPAGSNGDGPPAVVRPATAAQVRALHAIASRQNLDLVEELHGRFGVYRAHDLSIVEASRLIDAIKPSENGAEAAH